MGKDFLKKIVIKLFNKESKFVNGENPIVVFISSVMDDELAWARSVAEESIRSISGFTPWAFEYTPASSEDVNEGYLRKVRESDFVIWLIGKGITGPVKNELIEAINSNKRILAFKLPSETRNIETQDTIKTLERKCKWCEVKNKTEFLDAIQKTFTDEIIRALRNTRSFDRLANYQELWNSSRARCIARWQAVGIPLSLAISFFDDPTIGTALQGEIKKPITLLIGNLGTGKSLIAERVYQKFINNAVIDNSAPIPVYIKAQEITTNLQEKVLEETKEFGNPKRQGARIIIDGADETGISTASRILNMAREISLAWQNTSVLITSRPINVFTTAEETVFIPDMDISDVASLASKVSEQLVSTSTVQYLPKPIFDSIKRPIFTILWANYLRMNKGLLPKTIGELISYLINSSIVFSDLEENKSIELLEKLAIKSIDRGGSYIPWGEIGTRDDIEKLQKTRLVDYDNYKIGFHLPIFTHWFSAQSLIKGRPDILSIVNDPVRMDRWRYPFVILLSNYSFEIINGIFSSIIEVNPGFAAEIMSDAINESPQTSGFIIPSTQDCAEQYRFAMLAWIKGINGLSQYVAPLTGDGILQTVGVDSTHNQLIIGLYKGKKKYSEIERLPTDAMKDPGWHYLRSGEIGNQLGWSWKWSLEYLVDGIDSILHRNAFCIIDGPIYLEQMWQIAQKVMNHGNLYQDSILTKDLEDRLSKLLELNKSYNGSEFHELQNLVNKLNSMNIADLKYPWPSSDIDREGGWLWEYFSDSQLLKRAIEVYSASILEYENIVNVFFKKLKPRLLTATILPSRLVGSISFTDNATYGRLPIFRAYFDPLPEGSQSSVLITTGNERGKIDYTSLNLKSRSLRPHASEWIYAYASNMFFNNLCDVNPVTKIVYGWLNNDLKRINWT